MHGGGRTFLLITARDPAPGFLVELHVEPGQHDCALWKMRDGCKKLRSCRHRTRGAGSNHGLIAIGQALHLSLDEAISPIRGVDYADFPESLRPIAASDFQEVERVLPVLVELVRN